VKFGNNSGVAQAWEAIWSIGGNPCYLNTAAKMEVVAGASDVVGGAGACAVKIWGVNGNWEEASETITLTGTAAASSTNQYLSLYRAKVTGAGSALVNGAAVTIGDSVTTLAQIPAGSGQTFMAMRPVPANSKMYITGIGIAVAKNNDADLRIREYDWVNRVWRHKLEFHVFQSTIHVPFDPAYCFDAKHIIFLEAKSSTGTIEVDAWFPYYVLAGKP
jgi:hypothetical protein